MGLDMYARTRNAPIGADVDFKLEDNDAELFYWRKHPDLHGWMERLYREKGGTDEYFNVNAVQLTLEDLDRLEHDVRERMLTPTTGFFFGASGPEDEADDIAFIAKARAAIAEGKAVYYFAWW